MVNLAVVVETYRSLLLVDNFGIPCQLHSASGKVLIEARNFENIGPAGIEFLVTLCQDCAGVFGTLIC
jgi:hypothetical protein